MMKHNRLFLSGILAMGLPVLGIAQDNITGFEDAAGYTKLGVYDAWEESPFRVQKNETKAKLEGNTFITDNPDKSEEGGNTSEKVLAVQRSRYGSNLFGARIDLKNTFELTTTTKYVHVMIKKDRPGRVMLMGLGKRQDRAGQSAETEQFWVLSTRTIKEGVWNDAVFAIKGNGGIDIHSLVVVPDCESTHGLKEDFLVYVDDIILSDNATPRLKVGDYPINIEETTAAGKADRHVRKVQLTSPSAGLQTINVGSHNPQYIYRPSMNGAFLAKAGETVTPKIDYNGQWMNGFVYLDKGNDGNFDVKLAENCVIQEGSDLVSFGYIEKVENDWGYNSKGVKLTGGSRNTMTTPAFKLPEDLKPGFYRMRFKVDWGDADPAGRMTASNNIIQNGGSIVDVRLNVHGEEVDITTRYQNGDVFAADGSQLAGKKAKFGEPLTIKLVAENGFKPDGITLKHGYNLNGDSLVHETAQYSTVRIPAYAVREDGTLTIPAEYVDGNLDILGHFKSTTSEDASGNYEVNFDKNLPNTRDDRTLSSITVTGNKGANFKINVPTSPKTVYNELLDNVVKCTAGETITPRVNYKSGGPMHGYFYIDFDKNGIFATEIGADHKPTAASELISYSYYKGFNSAGQQKGQSEASNAITFPGAAIPKFVADGTYRARLKIDWDNIDPKGQYGGESNNIDANGGYVVDFMISVGSGTTSMEETAASEMSIKTYNNKIVVSTGKPERVQITGINGAAVFNGKVNGCKSFCVQKGIYIVNNHKVVVP